MLAVVNDDAEPEQAAYPPLASISEAILRCRALSQNRHSFEALDQLIEWGTLDKRLLSIQLGIIDLSFNLLRSKRTEDPFIRGRLWAWLQSFVIVDNLDDKRELVTIDDFVSRGGIELAVNELCIPNCDYGTIVLSTLAWCSMNSYHIPRIMGTGVHKDAIEYIASGRAELLDIYMALVRGLCGPAGSTRHTLRADGALDVAIPFLNDLAPENDDIRMRRGFRAASIITRLAGKDDSGIGPKVLRGNYLIVSSAIEMLDRVLDAGPKGASSEWTMILMMDLKRLTDGVIATGTVINMAIDPHLITMDIEILSRARENQRFFRDTFPVLLRALILRGDSNTAMVMDIIATMRNLSQSVYCFRVLTNMLPRLKEVLSHIFRELKDSKAIRYVKTFVSEIESATHNAAFGKNQSNNANNDDLINDGFEEDDDDDIEMTDTSDESMALLSSGDEEEEFADNDDESCMDVEESEHCVPLPSSTKQSMTETEPVDSKRRRRQRVALLYHWRHFEQVLKVEAMLRMRGADVYVDYCSQGSISTFNPTCAIVFMSSHFCLSQVCRYEYQVCANQKTPLFTLFCEPVDLSSCPKALFAPEQQQAAVFQTAIAGWTPQLLDSNVPKLLKTLHL